MNCKQGDLAIIIKSRAGNEGKIVEVLEFLGSQPKFCGYYWEDNDGPSWLVASRGSALTDWDGVVWDKAPVPDAFLRPIRPGELDDETEDSRELEGV